MMSTYSASNSQSFPWSIADRFGISNPSVARGAAGTMFFSVAASSLAQEVHAKEAPLVEKMLLPKDVVPYQYVACPICNKLGGQSLGCMFCRQTYIDQLLKLLNHSTISPTTHERLVAEDAGATAMYFVSKKLNRKNNITDERATLYGAAETWVEALKGREYLGGSNTI